MSKRNLSLAVCACLAAMVASGQSSYIFQVPGVNGSTTQVAGLGDNDFTRVVRNANGPTQAFQVLATPDGQKFFIVAAGGIRSVPATAVVNSATVPNASLSPLTTVGVSGTITSAAITPDGKYLLAVGDHFFIIKTSDNSVVQTDVGVPSNGAVPVGFAVSRDSRTVWVLSTANTQGTLEAVDLSSFQTSQPSSLSNIDKTSSITLSPLGLLYITSTGDLLYEVDPATLAKTAGGNIQIVSGVFGPLRFTPDGTAAFSVNQNVCPACASLIMLNVAAHSVLAWPANPDGTQPTFSDVFVGSSQVFAFASRALNPSASTPNIWDVSSSPLSAAASALGGFQGSNQGLPIYNTVAAAISNEPTPRFLYLLTQDSTRAFIRVNLVDGTVVAGGYLDPNQGPALSYAPIPAQSGAASIVPLNRTPNITAGATSTPLVGKVVDALGRPVMGVPVCFAVQSADLVINNASQVTNADGWVQTTVTASASAAGPYQIALTAGAPCPNAGGISTSFTVTVGAIVSGNSQISIYTGNGQLLRQQNSTTQTQPLTVKITNPDGTPLAGVQVSWAVTQGPGLVSPFDVSSDENGLFRANFITELVDQTSTHAFEASTVTASSPYGSVDFTETTQNAGTDDPGQPRVLLVTPEAGVLTIAQGDVLPGGIVAKTTSGHAPQAGEVIPNIGIRIADPDIADQSAALSCKGSSLGGTDGVSTCNVIAACQPAGTAFPQTFGAVAAVGEYSFYQLQVTLIQGKATLLSIVSGNNQVGTPGSSFTLLAKVTDSCNQNVNGVTVSWAVAQGSASLTQVQTVSSNNGTVSARVTLGAKPGPVQVTVSGAGLSPVIFNLTTQIPVSGVSLVSGGGQSARMNVAFANPVVFVVRDTSSNPVQGLLVNFSVSGSASINPSSATTNSQGQVQTTVTAGSTAGNVVVTATYNTLTATANLVVLPPGPQLTISSFTNAASGAVGLTPCGLVTATGPGIAPNFSGTVSAQQAGVAITANGISVPVLSVSNVNGTQTANFQAPCELTAGTATVVVTVNGTSSTVNGVPVLTAQPGIFVVDGVKHYGWVVREVDNSLVTQVNPARRGETLYMIVTGLGQVTPAAVTNVPGTGSQNVNLPIGVQVGGRGLPVPSARYLAGFLGAYIVEFQIPVDATLGLDQSLVIAAILSDGSIAAGNSMVLPGVIAP